MVQFTRLGFAAIALMIAQPVLAQPAPTSSEAAVEAACKADIAKYCAGVQPGEGRIGQCLKPHGKDLSAGCKQAAESAKSTK